ncbi:MAG: phosphate acetyltransferase [Clostridiales bacterium]|nr:phosphate acetyltransferase [Clostridiales bacterium]
MSFLETTKARAKADLRTIVLPETNDVRTIEAADKAIAEGIANIILVGSKAEIEGIAKDYPNALKAAIIDPESYEKFDEMVNLLVELRKAKGMTEEKAAAALKGDYLTFGVVLVKMGIADGMVSGACHATADVLRPALQIIKAKPGVSTVSSFFVMVVPNCDLGEKGTFVFSDCGLSQNPTSEELAAIACSAADSFKLLVQAEPKVAMLSHSTKGSAKHADIDKVTAAAAIAKELRPDILLDGELQADAAMVPSVGSSKAPGSPVAGQANVLVFPDLDAGNIGYKLVQRLAKAEAYGPATQGLAKPVNDLSRGCSADDIVGVIAITCVQAQANG